MDNSFSVPRHLLVHSLLTVAAAVADATKKNSKDSKDLTGKKHSEGQCSARTEKVLEVEEIEEIGSERGSKKGFHRRNNDDTSIPNAPIHKQCRSDRRLPTQYT